MYFRILPDEAGGDLTTLRADTDTLRGRAD